MTEPVDIEKLKALREFINHADPTAPVDHAFIYASLRNSFPAIIEELEAGRAALKADNAEITTLKQKLTEAQLVIDQLGNEKEGYAEDIATLRAALEKIAAESKGLSGAHDYPFRYIFWRNRASEKREIAAAALARKAAP